MQPLVDVKVLPKFTTSEIREKTLVRCLSNHEADTNSLYYSERREIRGSDLTKRHMLTHAPAACIAGPMYLTWSRGHVRGTRSSRSCALRSSKSSTSRGCAGPFYAGAVHACVVRACASHARVAYTCCACPCYACPRCASSCSVWCACAALTASALARLTTRRTGKPLDSGSGGGVNSLRQTCTASPCAAVALLLTASSSQELLVDCDFSLAKTTRQLCFFSKGSAN